MGAVLAVTCLVSGFPSPSIGTGSRTLFAQARDPATAYANNCASCHDAPDGRTPSKDALKSRTADAILTAMTSGTMAVQAAGISTAEKRALSEYDTVNHVKPKGGSIDAAGPVIADGLLITNSGYALWKGMPGNVLLAFSAK